MSNANPRRWRPFARARGLESGSFILDAAGTIVAFDEGMELLSGFSASDIVGRASGRGRDGAPIVLFEGGIAATDQPKRCELRLNHASGGTIEVEAVVQRMDGRGERIHVQVMRVLTRSTRSGRDAERDGVDPLTGLLDARTFARRLAGDMAEARDCSRPLALIYADVDSLRHINDRLGPAAGDDVLRKLAGILRVTTGDEERVARIEEDLFAILLPEAGRGDARQVAASLRTSVERFQFFDEPAPGAVTLSIGAASFPADADSETDLRERALEALDKARALGRNRVWCYMRRPRVPLQVPVFFDASEDLLVGYTRDLSPSGLFVQTSSPMSIGMKCALAFPLPGQEEKVHVIGRVVRSVPPAEQQEELRIPGMGVEFERFGGPRDRHAIETWLHTHEADSPRPENGNSFSV